jgi:hypothetical protein
MCHEASGVSYDRPIDFDDIALIARHYPRLGAPAIHAIYGAITDNHWPKPAVLIAILELVERALEDDRGLYPYPTMPFSAMDLTTYERVQSHGMKAFHSVFESMALAQRNMVILNLVLARYFKLKIVLFCDCGCSIVPIDVDAFQTDWYKRINLLRSSAEAVGTKVVIVNDFNDPKWIERLHTNGLDMGLAEMASYDRIGAILQSLPAREFDVFAMASPEFAKHFADVAA